MLRLEIVIMSPETEDEAIKEALKKILCNKYKRNVRITSFLKKEISNWRRSIVSRVYLRVAPVPRQVGISASLQPDEGDSCDETTVIVKQFNPDFFGPDWYGATGEDFIIAQESLGRILSGKRIAPEFYGTVCDVEKGRYWLLMEDLGENLRFKREYFAKEEMKHCLSLVEKLARIHLLFAEKEEELKVPGIAGSDMHKSARSAWRDGCESATFGAPDNIEKILQTGKFPWLNEMATDFAAIMEPCRSIIDFLISWPFCFTHGDRYNPENMVIGREGEEPIYYFIDWDDVAFGPVLDDLAGFLNYQNSPCHTDDFADFGYGRKETEELALVERYWECVKGSPLVPEELEECLMMYKYYKLMHTIRCICFHSECFIQSQFGEVSEGEIRRAIPVAIKLAKELRIM
jgi:hypothetical protein